MLNDFRDFGKRKKKRSGGSSSRFGYTCPICGHDDDIRRGYCNEVPHSLDDAIACNRSAGEYKKGDRVDEWYCTKGGVAGDSASIWIPYEKSFEYQNELKRNNGVPVKRDPFLVEMEKAEREAIRAEKAIAYAEARKKEKESKKTDPAIVAGRDAGYRSLIGKARLTQAQIENLMGRKGLKPKEIQNLINDGSIIPVNGLEAPISIPGWNGVTNGFLITSKIGDRIVGAQIARDELTYTDKEGNEREFGKYTWTRTYGAFEQTSALANGEKPVVAIPGSRTLYLIEGFLKAYIMKTRIDSGIVSVKDPGGAIIGVANGFTDSPETIREITQQWNIDRIVILSDSGSLTNPGVIGKYAGAAEIFPDLSIEVADYGQLYTKEKGLGGKDPDEVKDIVLDEKTIALSDFADLGTRIEGGEFKGSASFGCIRTKSPDKMKAILDSKNNRDRLDIVPRPSGSGRVEVVAKCCNIFSVLYAINGKPSYESYAKRLIWDIEFRDKALALQKEGKGLDQFMWIGIPPQTLFRLKDGRVRSHEALLNDEAIACMDFVKFSETDRVSESETVQQILSLIEKDPEEGFILALSADLGMGKSWVAAQIAKMLRFKCGSVPRVVLGKQLAQAIAVKTHIEAACTTGNVGVVMPISSMKEKNGYVETIGFEDGRSIEQVATGRDGIFIMDEVTAQVKMLLGSDIEGRSRREKFKSMEHFIKNAAHVLLMEANLPHWILEYIRQLRPDLVVDINRKQNAQGRSLFDIPSQKEWLSLLKARILKGDRVAVAIDVANASGSKINAEALALLGFELGLEKNQVRVATAATQNRTDDPNYDLDPNRDLSEVKLLIYSPVWQMGVSVDIEGSGEWDAVFCHFSGVVDCDGAYQMTGRIRSNCDRFVYAVEGRMNSLKPHTEQENYAGVIALTGAELVEEAFNSDPDFDLSAGERIYYALGTQELTIGSGNELHRWIQNQAWRGEEADSRNYRISLIDKMIGAGYQVKVMDPDERPDALTMVGDWQSAIALSQTAVDARYEAIFKAPLLNQSRAREIQKGSHHTTEEAMGFHKWDLQELTENRIQFESVEEIKTYDRTNRIKGLKRTTAIVTGVDESKAAATQVALRNDYEANYAVDNKTVGEYAKRLVLRKTEIEPLIQEAIAFCKNGGSLQSGVGILQAFITKIIENQEVLNNTFGWRTSDDRYRLRQIKQLLRSFGLETYDEKRIGKEKIQVFKVRIPLLTQRWIDLIQEKNLQQAQAVEIVEDPKLTQDPKVVAILEEIGSWEEVAFEEAAEEKLEIQEFVEAIAPSVEADIIFHNFHWERDEEDLEFGVPDTYGYDVEYEFEDD